MEITIDTRGRRKRTAIADLLTRTHCRSTAFAIISGTAVVARQSGAIVGVAALEVYRDGVLLRSVAVDPAFHATGLGRRLTDAALALARDIGAPYAYLLTTTAEHYFPKFGFERITRADVPASVQESIEFRSACPASAIVMRKAL